MEIGVTFPQLEIGDDPETIRDYARRVEDRGYDHLLAYDHVLGVNPDREGWEGPYDYESQFHEPFTTFTHLAAVTDEITFVTGILILPQRQTALVAKQAAQLDVLSGGRFRMGVGIGWNAPEYVALGEDFSKRGARIEEQIEVLRKLWTQELVEYEGEFHEIPDAGLNPLPEQQPIPIWMGGTADPVLDRVARMADGYLPQFQPGEEAEETMAKLHSYAEDAGRDPEEIGIKGRMYPIPGERDEWVERAQAWKDLGADHLSLTTMYQDLEGEEHVRHLEEVADVLEEHGLM